MNFDSYTFYHLLKHITVFFFSTLGKVVSNRFHLDTLPVCQTTKSHESAYPYGTSARTGDFWHFPFEQSILVRMT